MKVGPLIKQSRTSTIIIDNDIKRVQIFYTFTLFGIG